MDNWINRHKRHLNVLDLGMSDPLTLGMAHSLTERLECLATPKINRRVARTLTASVILGLGTLSAPLTIATESEPHIILKETIVKADGSDVDSHSVTVTDSGKTRNSSVIEVHKNNNGIEKRYEIHIEGDNFEAYEIDVAGRKMKVDPRDIDGFDAEKARTSKSWSFHVNDDNKLQFRSGKDIGKVDGSLHMFLDKDSRNKIKMFGGHENIEEALEGLEALKGLEKLEALESLKGLGALSALADHPGIKILEKTDGVIVIEPSESDNNFKTFSFSENMSGDLADRLKGLKSREKGFVIKRHSGDIDIDFDSDSSVFAFNSQGADRFFFEQGQTASQEARLAIAKSMLENAETMLEDLDDLEDTKSELARARRDLKKAFEALESAESKLEKK